MALTPLTAYTPVFKPLTNITPFTFRDGHTFLELYYSLKTYLEKTLTPELNERLNFIYDEMQAKFDELVADVNATQAAWDQLFITFTEEIERQVMEINNRVGAEGIKRRELVANTNFIIDPVWPDEHPIMFIYTQDEVGGRTLTFPPNVDGPVYVNPAPNGETVFTLIPNADTGRWKVKQSAFVDVDDYVDVASETVDALAGIQRAFDVAAASGRIAITPSPHYGLSSAFITRENLHVLAYGTTFHRVNNGNGMINNYVQGDFWTAGHNGFGNISIMGAVFDAHGDTQTANLNIATFDHSKNINLRDVTFRRARGHHSLELNAINGGNVDNIIFEGFIPRAGFDGQEALQIDCAYPGDSGLADGTMSKNLNINNITVRPYGSMGAHHVGVGSHTAPSGAYYDNIKITNITAIGCKERAVGGFRWRDSTVRDVSIDNPTDIGVRFYDCERTHLVGGYVKNATATNSQGVNISNNSKDCTATDVTVIGGGDGFYTGSGATNTKFNGCTSIDTKAYGFITNGSIDAFLEGCHAIRPGQRSESTAGAIRVTGGSVRTSISSAKGVPKRDGTAEALYGISVDSSAVDTWAVNCDFLGFPAFSQGPLSTTPNRV